MSGGEKMEANVFVAQLKADGSKNDLVDLVEVRKQYDDILMILAAKDRAPFALNVLCTLCRNIEKVPSWSSVVDTKLLLLLSLDCIRETQHAEYEQVKMLACVYHIHKYAVRQKSAPPKIVVELSYVVFNKSMLKEYCKTYWNILGDRIAYIEKIKASSQDIIKFYPKLIEDITIIIETSGIEFCLFILTYIVKKLHNLYSNLLPMELNEAYRKLFDVISQKNDLRHLKKMAYKDVAEIYVKLCDCLYIIAENSSLNKFRNSPLNSVVQTCMSLIGHSPDLLYCVQNIYLNGFCSILTENPNLSYIETVFTNLVSTCESSEKLGYNKAMNATYPYLNQFLKLYLEYNMIKNGRIDSNRFTEAIQIECLKLLEFLLRKLKNCNQLIKCDNCQIKTGLHDGLRLSLLVKDVIATNIEQKLSIENILPVCYSVILKQYEILTELCSMGCVNYQKCYKKLQTDVHNTAILLNKSQNYEYSIKLFEIYLKNEVHHFKTEQDLKNISRALYNKSICELDCKLYEDALQDAYLSLIFAYPESLSSEKYMSIVMDIKAKKLKSESDDDDSSSLQMVTVIAACVDAVCDDLYGNLKPFFCNLRFSELLEHEYGMYAKLWPSIGPIAAVCEALLSLSRDQPAWIVAKDTEAKRRLYKIVIEAPSVVNTVHHDVYAKVVNALVQDFETDPPTTMEERICLAAMMFLKAEFDMAEASDKFGWDVPRDSETEETQSSCTLAQEYEAVKYAIRGVELWKDVVANIDPANVPCALRPAQCVVGVWVPQLWVWSWRAHALQQARTCSRAARLLRDQDSYLWNEALIIRDSDHTYLPSVIDLDTAPGLMHAAATAMHYNRIGYTGVAAKLIQALQAKLLAAYSKNPDDNLELAMGYVLDAQAQAYKGATPSALSAAVGAQRHYAALAGGRGWARAHKGRSSVRVRRAMARSAAVGAAYNAARLSLALGQSSRARALSSVQAGAMARARLTAALVEPARAHDAQLKIDYCLKHTLGIPASADRPEHEHPDDIIPRLNPAWPPGPTSGLAVRTAGLEAATSFRAKQFENAKKYYQIAFKSIPQAETYIKNSLKNNKMDETVLKTTQNSLISDLRTAELEILIEAAFFELSQENYKSADEYVVRIHEVLDEDKSICCYLKSDVLNLMTASAYLRKGTTKKIDTENLEAEFENLRLSPVQYFGVPKTPEVKAAKPPQIIKLKAKDEEVPKTKRRVIKINLDENGEEKQPEAPKKPTKQTAFKFPEPVLPIPVLEVIPPTPKQKPDIIVTTASHSILEFATPKPSNKSDFFSPVETPSEQFFTPMSTMKTYSKTSLRQGLVKNLESEFCTPKSELKKPVIRESRTKTVDKKNCTDNAEKVPDTKAKIVDKKNCTENVKSEKKPEVAKTKIVDKENITENASILSLGVPKTRAKKGLIRATSPGKLEKRETRIPTRASRLRQPVRLSVDDENKK